MRLLSLLDGWFSVFRYYWERLKKREHTAIFAIIVLLCAISLHIVSGMAIFFFLDICVFIAIYQTFKMFYISDNYPK